MSEKRYYFDGKLEENTVVKLEGQEFHHMANVMRERVGNSVILFNGNGNFYFGNIEEINKKFANVVIKSKQKSLAEPSINLDVYQALAKGDKLSLITQKIAELGANKLCLFESKFCDVKSNTGRSERLDAISVAASKQCGRATLLKIDGIFSVSKVAEKVSSYDCFFVAYENETGETLADAIDKIKATGKKNIAIMIGAEGGFDPEEIALLTRSGAHIVTLGKRILRTETAAIAGTALIMQEMDK